MTTASLSVKPQETGSERPVNPAAAPATATEGERPAWLPSNFKSPEQMVESYKELQATLTKMRQPPPETNTTPPDVKPEEKPEGDKQVEPEVKPEGDKQVEKAEAEVAKQLEADGVNVEEMSDYFAEHGDLTDDHKKVLTEALDAKFGTGKGSELLADYLASKKIAAEYTEMKVYEPLGGSAGAKSILDWASKGGVNEAQAKAINTLWEGNSLDSQVEGSKLLRTLYDAANGKAPSVVLDGGNSPNAQDVYSSMHEASNDMADPRYKTDETYRNRVAQKLARSTF